MNEKQKYALLDLTQLPENLWNVSLDKIPFELGYVKIIKDYCDNLDKNIKNGTGLYLWGNFGRGKSALAAIILMQALAQNKLGFWVNAKKIPGYVIEKTCWKDDTSVQEWAMATRLLVIDEFQVRSEIKFSESVVEDWVRERLGNKKSTIITTNVAPAQLKISYPAMYNVLQEIMIAVEIDGHDFRAEVAKQRRDN